MKKFIMAMASLSLLAGCGGYWIINLSGETVKINDEEAKEICEKVSYSFFGVFGGWPVEIKVADQDTKTKEDKNDYTIHPGGEIKEATEAEIKQCDEGKVPGESESEPEPEADPNATAVEAAKAANDAAAAVKPKVEAYKAAKTLAREASNTHNPGNTYADPAVYTAAQNAVNTALAAAAEAVKAATAAAEAAKAAAAAEGVSAENKTAAKTAAAAAEKAVADAKAAGVEAPTASS